MAEDKDESQEKTQDPERASEGRFEFWRGRRSHASNSSMPVASPRAPARPRAYAPVARDAGGGTNQYQHDPPHARVSEMPMKAALHSHAHTKQ